MRHRVQILFAFFAWFLATGSQWDVVQVIAWGRMFAGNVQEMTFTAAARKTFSGEMCDLCQTAQAGRRQQERNSETPDTKVRGKALDLSPLTMGVALTDPLAEPVVFAPDDARMAVIDRESPPTPPPRAGV